MLTTTHLGPIIMRLTPPVRSWRFALVSPRPSQSQSGYWPLPSPCRQAQASASAPSRSRSHNRPCTSYLALRQHNRNSAWPQPGAATGRVMSRLQILPVLFLLALLALSPLPSMAQEPDYDIPGGHFYTQASGQGGGAGTGYRITDEADIPFWTQFQGLGGVTAVGYVSSRRFEHNGLTNQATQKYVLQWQPGGLYYLNVFDELSAMGKDAWLSSVPAIPQPA